MGAGMTEVEIRARIRAIDAAIMSATHWGALMTALAEERAALVRLLPDKRRAAP